MKRTIMKRTMSMLIAIALIFTVGADPFAVASRQVSDSSLLNREPPDCRYEPCG